MPLFLFIVIFSLIGGVFSLIGGLVLLAREQFTKGLFVHLISFAAGALLGAAFLDLFPEAIETGIGVRSVFLWALGGFVALFLIEGIVLRFHHHDEHHLSGSETDEGHEEHPASTPWMLLGGDAIHNFMDGVAITAAFLVNIPLGIVTAFAVAAHEIPQEVGDFSVMLHSGWARRKVLFWNVAAALMTTAGAITAFAFRDFVEPIVGYLLALTAGFFIYIASADLIPELYRNSKRDKLSHVMILFVLGIIVVGVLAGITKS